MSSTAMSSTALSHRAVSGAGVTRRSAGAPTARSRPSITRGTLRPRVGRLARPTDLSRPTGRPGLELDRGGRGAVGAARSCRLPDRRPGSVTTTPQWGLTERGVTALLGSTGVLMTTAVVTMVVRFLAVTG